MQPFGGRFRAPRAWKGPDIWNFNTTGFQSLVEYSPRTKYDAKTKTFIALDKFATQLPADYVAADSKQGIRSSHLLARSRVRADLDALKAYDAEAIVFEDLTADYQFRMIIRRTAVAQFQYDLTMGIDHWSHIKEEMNRRSPESKGRMTAYYAVWTAVSKIQPNPPYGLKPYTASDWSKVSGKWEKKPATKDADQAPKGGGKLSRSAFDDDLFADDPSWDKQGWEIDLWLGKPSRVTMEAQVKELIGYKADDLDAIVDRLEETFGTVDLDTIAADEVWQPIDADRDPVRSYTRTSPNGVTHQVHGYGRTRATGPTTIRNVIPMGKVQNLRHDVRTLMTGYAARHSNASPPIGPDRDGAYGAMGGQVGGIYPGR